jgi:hypothetical protein
MDMNGQKQSIKAEKEKQAYLHRLWLFKVAATTTIIFIHAYA